MSTNKAIIGSLLICAIALLGILYFSAPDGSIFPSFKICGVDYNSPNGDPFCITSIELSR